jgi:hypothetical protein
MGQSDAARLIAAAMQSDEVILDRPCPDFTAILPHRTLYHGAVAIVAHYLLAQCGCDATDLQVRVTAPLSVNEPANHVEARQGNAQSRTRTSKRSPYM